MSGIYHENKLWANVSGPNVAGATPSENLSTLTIDGVTYDTTELVFCYDDNGSLYTDSTKATAVTGDESKLYIATNTGKQYRYNGSAFSALGVNAINDLSDVTITSASDGQALEYDATAGKWKNVAKKAADTPTFSEASTRANLSGSGETMVTILGKIKKWFSDLKAVAFSGSYNDLTNKPTIPAAQVNSDWDASSGVAQILHKPALATVATSGSYNDLSNKPTIPTVNNGTLTIQKNGTNVQTFSANQSGNATANITVPEVEETDTTNSTPYLYRASQNSGDRCYLRQLVGASFGVNQLVENADIFTANLGTKSYNSTTGILTYTPSSISDAGGLYKSNILTTNRKYLLIADINPSSDVSIAMGIGGNVRSIYLTGSKWNRVVVLHTPNNSATVTMYARMSSAGWTSGTIQFKNIQLIDLTQMFGTSIADKAYTMEQSTAGSGIAWLKSYGFLTESYYPYNTGSLQSVNTSGKVCCGKNWWKYGDVTFTGYNSEVPIDFDLTGTFTISLVATSTDTDASTCAMIIYYKSGSTSATYQWSRGSRQGKTFNIGDNVVDKIRFYSSDNYNHSAGDTANFKEIQLEIGSTQTEYEPYTTHTTPISLIDLRGVPTLVDNNIVYDGDVENADGGIDRKYRQMDFGDVPTFGYISEVTNPYFYCNLLDLGCKESGGNAMAEGFANIGPTSEENFRTNAKNMDMAKDANAPILYFRCTSYTTAAAFKTAFTGKKLQFSRATVLKEQTTPIENPEMYCKEGTEQFLTENNIPVGHESLYVQVPEWMTQGYYGDFRDRVDSLVYDKVWKLVGVFSHGQTPIIPKDCNELLLSAVSENGAEYYGGEVFPYALYGSKFLVARPIDTNYVCELKPDGAIVAGGVYKLAIFYR